ncbi:MAG: Tol-Pal system beta propeller repeat protein TolB [Thermodesulfobacteriota bacterium]
MRALLLALLAVIAFAGPALAQNRDVIVIEGPFLRKIPLAIPGFVAGNADPHTAQACAEGPEILSSALGFTGYFSLIPKAAFIGQVTDAVPPGVVFKDWTAVGADLIITGKAWYDATGLTMNLRLFDTVSGGLILGRNYHGPVNQLRQMIYWFCTAMIQELSGSQGFFESKLAFVSTTTGNKEVYICDFDGQNIKQVSFDSDLALSPSWSPDGRYLAYVSYKYRARDIIVANLDRNENVKISDEAHCSAPVFAPEGFTLACSMSREGNADIYTLTGTGKIIKRMTSSWGLDTSPSWTPDGKKLVFASDRGGSPQIYILDIETGIEKRLTYSGSYNSDPCVSPNGRAIAYCSKVGGRFEIFVMGVNGENPTAITRGQGDNESPTWSPDGSLVAFATTREGPWRVYVSSPSGTDQRRLILMPGQQTQPAWSRNMPRQ